MSERITLFVDVLLPLAVKGSFTYRVPIELNDEVGVGKRVVVNFGKSKLYTALIVNIHQQAPVGYTAKYIHSVLDLKPVVLPIQFSFWNWMSNYYMCSMGEVMAAALPSGLKLNSETRLCLNENYDGDTTQLSDKEFLLYEALHTSGELTLQDIVQIVEQKNIYSLIRSLFDKRVVLIEEELKERYKPIYETYIDLNKEFASDEALQLLMNQLEKRAFKQLQVLIKYLSFCKFPETKPVNKKEILKDSDDLNAALGALIKKNIFEVFKLESSRLQSYDATHAIKELSDVQQNALSEVKECFKNKDVVLLHGVTSSGKTEIYIKLIEEAINKGEQVLFLLPEIALTSQIINRLRAVFGNQVGVYHSRFNEQERVEIWNKVLDASEAEIAEYKVILGARSALFLPFTKLGLVIIDEEHETSYKQHDPAPRYHARDAALYLANLHKTKVLLGSATPSFESYYKATTHKFGLVSVTERYKGIELPEIKIVNVSTETKQKTMHSHFSSVVLDTLKLTIENKEQAILFQNRRGFAPLLECEICAWTPTCKNCDVSLSYHKAVNVLRCHYCGYTENVPATCSACGSASVQYKGFGTEKIEDELSIFMPEIKIERMDLDSTRSRFSYQRIIQNFEEGQTDVLVGTQMITKGLDFDNVSLVVILNADSMLNFPDFRAFERAYQLMEQVSGRAGRKNKRGTVIIQTRKPEHFVIEQLLTHNYQALFNVQMNEREKYHYPPFYNLIKLTLKHKDIDVLNYCANMFVNQLKVELGQRVLGPEFPGVSKVRNYYLKEVLIKLEKDISQSKVKQFIRQQIDNLYQLNEFKSLIIQPDVDPV